MKAIRVHQVGDPEVLQVEEMPIPEPKPNEVLINLKAIGVNYIDIYQRTGVNEQSLPFTPGMEAAGVVEAVGADVTAINVGDRVAYATITGAYAEFAVVPGSMVVPIPDELDFVSAAGVML